MLKSNNYYISQFNATPLTPESLSLSLSLPSCLYSTIAIALLACIVFPSNVSSDFFSARSRICSLSIDPILVASMSPGLYKNRSDFVSVCAFSLI